LFWKTVLLHLSKPDIRTLFLGFSIFASSVWGAHVKPNDSYLHTKSDNIDLIIASEYQKESSDILSFEEGLLQTYSKLYGYKLDDTLYLGLASSKNQIANAFSTQIPLNMQMNYIGGSLLPDYFSTTSWLKTILIHESAHNFQLNAKHNPLSKTAHKIFKNTPVTWLYIAPLFPVPNLMESSFMLEGNAVLNESLFDNGGRLYSGAFWAMTLTQAKAGLITPQRLYNDHLFFPYGTHHYIVGGFFQLFLAQRYGIEKVNRYFLAYSDQWLPFFTNAVCRNHFGKNFETLVFEYKEWLGKKMSEFHETEGKQVAFSKSFTALNSNKKEIFFLTTDNYSAPEMVKIDKRSTKAEKKRGNYLFGKAFKLEDKYYTLASASVENDKITIALFDEKGNPLKGSQSQALQTILPNGEKLYFDVARSYDGLHLYRDKKFLGVVNSSVISDEAGNYYYFKQQGNKRILCKNRESLFTFDGYYGKIADVNSNGKIYFIANSKAGSSLYSWYNGVLAKEVEGDDVIDAKLLDDHTALLAVMRADGIAFIKSELKPYETKVYERHYFFENNYVIAKKLETKQPKLTTYNAWNNLHYSALTQNVEVTEDDEINFNISATFSDPLERNHLRIFTSRYDEESIAGIGYDNSSYLLDFGADIYGVLSHDENISDRGFGINAYMHYPWYHQTYTRGDIRLSMHMDSDKDAKSPLNLDINWRKSLQFGNSFYPDFYSKIGLFTVYDRSDIAYGARFSYMKDLLHELYAGADIHYAKSNTKRFAHNERGILIDDTAFSGMTDSSRFVMPSLSREIYAKEAFKAEVSLAKVLEFNKYYFSFPLSLRREVLYGKYRYFNLKGNEKEYDFSEYTVGLTLELLVLHKLPLPISFEWLKNDDLKDANNFRMIVDLQF
jgi:hypothetical protein